MKKRLILELDHVTGEVGWENPDKLNNFEALGLVEMFKVMLIEEVINDEKE